MCIHVVGMNRYKHRGVCGCVCVCIYRGQKSTLGDVPQEPSTLFIFIFKFYLLVFGVCVVYVCMCAYDEHMMNIWRSEDDMRCLPRHCFCVIMLLGAPVTAHVHV